MKKLITLFLALISLTSFAGECRYAFQGGEMFRGNKLSLTECINTAADFQRANNLEKITVIHSELNDSNLTLDLVIKDKNLYSQKDIDFSK